MRKNCRGWDKWEATALQNGIDYHTYYRRVTRSGWEQERAATENKMSWNERRKVSLQVRRSRSRKKVVLS